MRLKNNPKQLFAPRFSINARMVLFAAVSIALMIADQRLPQLRTARAWLSLAAYPLVALAQLPAGLAATVEQTLDSRRELRERIERLRRERLLLDAQLQRLTALETENRRLRLLLKSSAEIPERVLIAELLSVDLSPYRDRILLNKGSRHGVGVGQPLLAHGGLVGQITRVNPLTSSAILISDANHTLPVQIDRTGQRTLARGGGETGTLELTHLPNDNDVRVGDTVSTSGLGGRFPRGLPVATIDRVELDPGQPFAHVRARPAVRLDRIREVLVVIRAPAPPPDFGGEDAEPIAADPGPP